MFPFIHLKLFIKYSVVPGSVQGTSKTTVANRQSPSVCQQMINKEIIVYPYNAKLLNNKEELLLIWGYNMDELQKHYTEKKQPDTKGSML